MTKISDERLLFSKLQLKATSMNKIKSFYNQFHQQNKKTKKLIKENNFTYYYLLKLVNKWIPDLKNKKVLDVGCGVGTMALYMATKGAKQVLGIDISERAICLANYTKRELVLNKKASFECVELEKGKGDCDVVTCCEVIEHIEDDLKFLKKIRTHLKQDGIFILSTPSKENFLNRIDYFEDFDKKVGHLRRYSKEELEELLKKADFKILEIKQQEGPIRTILFTSKLGFLIKGIKGPLVPIFHLIDDGVAKVIGGADWQVVAKISS